MALSADTPRNYSVGTLRESAQPVQASVTCYAGAAVSRDSGGEVGPLAAGEAFAGFVKAQATGTTAGAINVAVYDKGEVELTITGLDDNNDIGDTVYATDDGTFTLTASGAVSIGKVSRIVSLTGGKAMVSFEADTVRSI
jgi:hypothetical protein